MELVTKERAVLKVCKKIPKTQGVVSPGCLPSKRLAYETIDAPALSTVTSQHTSKKIPILEVIGS